MNSEINSIVLWLLVLFIYWWFIKVSASTSLAELRHELFTARGKLFDKAYEVDLDFDSEAYGITRTTLNGLIRFAHKISFTQVIVMLFVSKNYWNDQHRRNYEKSLDNAIEDLNETQKELILEVTAEANRAVLIYIVKTSLLLNIVLVPIVIIAVTLKRYSQLKARVAKSSFAKNVNSVLDAEANAIGH